VCFCRLFTRLKNSRDNYGYGYYSARLDISQFDSDNLLAHFDLALSIPSVLDLIFSLDILYKIVYLSTEMETSDLKKLISISQRWLTIREACLYSKMSKNTLMECIEAGQIKASKKRGKWIVDRLSIDAYYEDIEVEALYKDVARRSGLC
jgi:excisionase family DNA binding protein